MKPSDFKNMKLHKTIKNKRWKWSENLRKTFSACPKAFAIIHLVLPFYSLDVKSVVKFTESFGFLDIAPNPINFIPWVMNFVKSETVCRVNFPLKAFHVSESHHLVLKNEAF